MNRAQAAVKQRIDELFSKIDPLAIKPPANGAKIKNNGHKEPIPTFVESEKKVIHDIETLLKRIEELEGKVKEAEQKETLAPVETKPNAPTILYEKEQVGFAFNGDSVVPHQADPENALRDDKVVTTPLIASGKTIGEVAIVPPNQTLSPEEESLANAVAQQASLQIENLRLLAAAERARAEALAATRQFTHESWENYLDGIQNNQRIGFAYNQNEVAPFDQTFNEADLKESVNVLEEQVGNIFIKEDPKRPFTPEDKAMVSAVAYQIAQQAENLRLLADAARARAEAEEANRLLTRENWKNYINKDDEEKDSIGFVYNSNQVLPLDEPAKAENLNLAQPLTVRGEPIGFLSVAGLQHISQEAKELAESVAKQTSIHLETLRLTEELQRRAQELQELDRLKSAFLANMSHELRTPLNSILGFSDVMLEGLDGPLTENMSNDLSLIQKNGQHLLHLINDVLDMAKIESGKMNLHPERFKIYEILDEVTSITSTLASEKNLALFIEPSVDAEVEINADRTRIRQVMINLVNNAIKFTEKGKIAINASRFDKEHALITVKDTGLGIPPEQLELIFQEFTQVDTSTTRKVGGTGLGLPISRRLINMHGGELWAESTGVEGEGATFFVKLPYEAKIAEEDKQEKVHK